MFLIITCTILMIFGFLYASPQQVRLETPDGESRYVLRRGSAIYLVAVLVIVSTLRYGFVDTFEYKKMYLRSAHNWRYIFTGGGWGIETGWLFVNYCLSSVFRSPKILLFLSALVIDLAYMKASQRYSEDACLSFFLFLCLMYMDTNNGLRQMVAAAIVILSFPLLEQKRYIFFAFWILVAYQMHNSAIVWILIAAAAVGKPMNLRTKAALALGVAFLLIPGILTRFIDFALEDSQYNYYLDKRGGMRMARALVTGVVPGALAILYYFREKKFGREMDSSEALIFNILIINTMFVLMGTYMQYWNRFAFYTFFAPMILVPKLARKVFGDGSYYGQGIRFLMIILYFAYFCYNIYSNSGLPGAASDSLKKFYIEWWC